MSENLFVMTPREIVQELDKHIIGQTEAKRAVAIALRNRWRRMQIADDLRHEVTPKNILMIGPTGVGKTEIARRLARLANAPFIKVEATKFTEVGYVGRDVESIIRDLIESAVVMKREEAYEKVKTKAEKTAEDKIIDILLPRAEVVEGSTLPEDTKTREVFRKKLNSGELDENDIEVDLHVLPVGVEIMGPPGMEEMTNQLSSMFQSLAGKKKKKRKIKIKDAFKQLREEEAAKLVDDEELKNQALQSVEQNGIVFIDEIDKIARSAENGVRGGDISREGVQRDLLPLIEGCTVATRYGVVKTDHILFITSGAFHSVKPSDLAPELQGRLPIRVELKALTTHDFARILTEPKASLTEQYRELLKTEKVTLKFTKDGIQRIAEIAFRVNERQENIGARRLHTVMERLLETISFEASDRSSETVTVNKKYVDENLDTLMKNEDLTKYIL